MMKFPKYQLDIIPFECTQTYPSTTHFASYQHMERFINDLHYGCHYELRRMRPYRVKGAVRYGGMFYKTKMGKTKVSWGLNKKGA